MFAVLRRDGAIVGPFLTIETAKAWVQRRTMPAQRLVEAPGPIPEVARRVTRLYLGERFGDLTFTVAGRRLNDLHRTG